MEDQIEDFHNMLTDDDLKTRITAVEFLGEIGNKESLRLLRERLAIIGKEHEALVIAVGKLKRKLGVK